jgi:hemerythrin-like domain-containing protein
VDADLAGMSDVLQCLAEYRDRYHHPIERVALQRLVQRGQAEEQLANDFSFEHLAVGHYGDRLLTLLRGPHDPGRAQRAWIAMAAHQYVGAFHALVTHEERMLLPLVERHLAQPDWDALTQSRVPADDPCLGAKPTRK